MAAKASAVKRKAASRKQPNPVRDRRKGPTNVVPFPSSETVVGGKTIRRGPHGVTVIDGTNLIQPRIPQAGEHDENLVDKMDPGARKVLANLLIEYFEVDDQSRKDWLETSRKGVALMGLSQLKDSDALYAEVNAPGHAQVKAPLISEACVNFQARSISEIFPATGPLKTQIIGDKTAELQAQADRIEVFGNYYLTVLDKGYFQNTDQMLMLLPIDGSIFRKAEQCPQTGLPKLRFVRGKDFVINYAATSLEDADRYAHRYEISGREVKKAQNEGVWSSKIRLHPQRLIPDEARDQTDDSDGRRAVLHDDDALHEFYEYHIDLELDVDAKAIVSKDMDAGPETRPYIVVVEKDSAEILMIRRNWDEADKQCRKLVWFAHHKFFPGLGFYGWGYPHLIGSLQKAVSDGINALLDAGYAANFRGGFITDEGAAAGINSTPDYEIEHGKYKRLKGTWEEINKAIYSPEFKEPSTGLSNLVVSLIELFRRFASTTESAVGDADNTGPVGTTIALIEQSNVIPTAIHKRLHNSVGDEFSMWAKLVYLYMPDKYPYQMGAQQQTALRSDFDGKVDIVPVSDPNISSQTQRLALSQGTIELQAQAPDIYPVEARIEAHRRMLRAMRVPDPDAVGPRVETPKNLDPVAESQMLVAGKGVQAFEPQDHQGHLMVHQWAKAMLMNSPQFQSWEPERQQAVIGAFDAHEADHMGLLFRRQIMQTTGIALPPAGEELPPEIEVQITQAIVAKLPPPPPLPAAGENGAMEADAQLAKTRATIQGKKEETDAKIERDTSEWETLQQREQEAFEREEARKDQAHQNELRRKQQMGALDLAAKETTVAQQLQHGDAKNELQIAASERQTAAKLRQGEAAAGAKLKQGERAAGAKLRQGDDAHGQQMRHGDESHEQQLLQSAQQTEQQLRAAEQQSGQQLKHDEAAHTQAMKHLEQDAELAAKQSEGEHKQGIRHKASEHSQQTRFANEDHDDERRRSEESHRQQMKQGSDSAKASLKQTEAQGKLKISQAKEAARAKKQAAKKKTGKK